MLVCGALTFCAVDTLTVLVPFFAVDAVTLDATTRLTNIQFTADLQDASSQAYKDLTESILEEVSVCVCVCVCV